MLAQDEEVLGAEAEPHVPHPPAAQRQRAGGRQPVVAGEVHVHEGNRLAGVGRAEAPALEGRHSGHPAGGGGPHHPAGDEDGPALPGGIHLDRSRQPLLRRHHPAAVGKGAQSGDKLTPTDVAVAGQGQAQVEHA